MSDAPRPYIVHVTADHPDVVQPAKSPVVARLVELVGGTFEHKVVSLDRRSLAKASWAFPRFALHEAASEHAIDTLVYTAPPAGIYHRRMLVKLGEALAQRLSDGPLPDLLIGHKLTVEGIAVARAAELLGVPYALSIQGNTDERILRMRPDLKRHFAPIYHGAAHVFPFTPWAREAVEARLGARDHGVTLLPCPMARDTQLAPRPGGDSLVTAFHLRNAKLKNLPAMAKALDAARREHPKLTLSVIGGGSTPQVAAARAHETRGMEFEGPIPNDRIAERFNAATGFILPSRRESFGLVFVEALFAGLPIAYPRRAAVDGYFDDCPFAVPVNASDKSVIAAAMATLHREEAALKDALAQWQGSEAARRFTRPAIGAAFRAGIEAALGRSAAA